MKDYSITRIPNNDLIGLLFYPIVSLSEYEIEVIHPEYVDGSVVTGSGSLSPDSTMSYAVVDVSKYDYVIAPITTDIAGTSYYTGFNATGIGAYISSSKAISLRSGSNGGTITAWGIFKIDSQHIKCVINCRVNAKMPVIGLRRHRSDNVNPRSPQRPELEPIEIRERQESEPEPVPEIAEPEEETPEEVEEE